MCFKYKLLEHLVVLYKKRGNLQKKNVNSTTQILEIVLQPDPEDWEYNT